ncbi:50S ribosome-binding GTPase [Salinispirillum sp. LH 10-3-1]|uniref:50S ribosome-binding GTPase n=1 Tax=Salinispirillum sp. LH 10-3-1 TaxID=2952525 RepID=A0AB38YBK7_9GAMM
MKILDVLFDKIQRLSYSESSLQNVDDAIKRAKPTIVLLGKTGVGKSSLVAALTGDKEVEVGLGYKPCTNTLMEYPFPQDTPVMSFLDTRGLGEAGYKEDELSGDLERMVHQAHVLVVVIKSDDPDVQDVLAALKALKTKKGTLRKHPILLIHSFHDAGNAELVAQQQVHHAEVQRLWPKKVESFALELSETDAGDVTQLDAFREALFNLLPQLAVLLANESLNTEETQFFNAAVRSKVLAYASSAATIDLFPVAGLVGVPSIHAALLVELARQFDVAWSRALLKEFLAALGAGFALHYSLKLGVRQLVKLIPYYGQTIGALSASTISFGTTYGLGRAAAQFLYMKKHKIDFNDAEIKAAFKHHFGQAVNKDAP